MKTKLNIDSGDLAIALVVCVLIICINSCLEKRIETDYKIEELRLKNSEQ